MRRLRILTAGVLGIAAALLAAPPASAQSATAVKAAFLARFGRYVEWPPSAEGAALQVCTIGGSAFSSAEQRLITAENIEGNPVRYRHLASTDGAETCGVAFLAGSATQSVGQMLAVLSRRPVLTVTDASLGGQRGIIHFIVAGGRVRFFIDDAQAAAQKLGISSRLLDLAIGVRGRRK